MSFMATHPLPKDDEPSAADIAEAKKAGKHRRNYQACEPCRERKVKCDLGNVDNPLPPPCAKCKREQKNCWFRETRKKEGAAKDEEPPPVKRQRTDSAHSRSSFAPLPVSPQLSQNYGYQNPLSPARPYAPNVLPNTPPLSGVSSYAAQPRSTPTNFQTPPNGSLPLYRKQEDMWSTKNTSVSFQQQPARANGDDHMVMPPHASSLNQPFTNTTDNMSVLISAAKSTEAAHQTAELKRTHNLIGTPVEPDAKALSPSEAKARLEARKAWSNVKFVKAGWFSPDEALDYIKFFYTKLAPMTPVRIQEFADPSQHERLLKEEPVLALAILAISSRYMEFNHPSKVGRGYYVHEKLWNSLQKIVQRLLWGQEQFGGGFTGAGSVQTKQSATGQITWKGSLRTLGTIEAILLLTDWQPRALHFPPGDDENKLVGGTTSLMEEDVATPAPSVNIPYAIWLEPAWRSDRMSWMLLGLAVHLGHELAVFDRSHEICKMDHSEQSECMRRRRVRRLIITYVSQISGRIGIQPSLAPIDDIQDSRGPDANTPDDVMQKLWFQIAHIMYDANQDIFPTHEKTAEYIENGHYRNLIGGFSPRLQNWLSQYESAKSQLDPMMVYVLKMEYEYARLYVNSLGLQKVVGAMALQDRNSVSKGLSAQLGSVYDDNKAYINEVRAAARSILESSCYGIGGQNALGYAPVRTFLRTLSALMFSLKLFSLGNDERAVRKTFNLMREMTKRMREQTADDVHLSPHVARLIQSLMEEVHSTMVRIPKPTSRSATRQPTPAPLHHHAGSMSESSDQQSPDPLGEIQFANLANQTIMPPPGFDMQYDMTFDQSVDPALFPSNDDWIAMPFDGLLDFDASTVNQGYGGIGPTFGDRDMLSLMTGSHLDQTQHGLGSGMPTTLNGAGFGGNGY